MHVVVVSNTVGQLHLILHSSDLHVHSEGGRPTLLLGMHCDGGRLRGDAHILECPLLKLQHNTSQCALEDRHCVAVEDANHRVVIHLVGREQGTSAA